MCMLMKIYKYLTLFIDWNIFFFKHKKLAENLDINLMWNNDPRAINIHPLNFS